MNVCSLNENSPSYGSSLYCKICGMDIGFDAVRIRKGEAVKLYCCKVCAKAK